MEFSYKKLWKLLIDREMQKKELCALAGISTATISKMPIYRLSFLKKFYAQEGLPMPRREDLL